MTPPDLATQSPAALGLHEQQLTTMAQIGRVVEGGGPPDPPKPEGGIPTVLVHVGGEAPGTFTRTWMPWLVARAGGDAEWWAPDVEEQVMVLAPSGNLSQGIIIGSLLRGGRLHLPTEGEEVAVAPDSRHAVPDGRGAGPVEALAADGHVRVHRDGTTTSYDRGSHVLGVALRTGPDQDAAVRVAAQADEGQPGDATVSIEVGPHEGASRFAMATAGETRTLEVSVATSITLTVGTTTFVMSDKAITLTAGGTTLTIDESGVNAA